MTALDNAISTTHNLNGYEVKNAAGEIQVAIWNGLTGTCNVYNPHTGERVNVLWTDMQPGEEGEYDWQPPFTNQDLVNEGYTLWSKLW